MSIPEIRTIEDLLSCLGDDFRSCDLKFCDLAGRWHHVTVPASTAKKGALERGVGFDGSSVPGFTKLERGDLILIPDPTTTFVDPFFEEPTLSVICDCRVCGSLEPFDRDPRRVAMKAEQYLASFGVVNESFWLPEFEFNVFSSVSFYEECYGSGFMLHSMESLKDISSTGEGGLDIGIPPKSGYHTIPPSDQLIEVRSRIVAAMEEAGIPVKYHHHEVGANGQVEIESMFTPLLCTADNIMLSKYLIRNIARSLGTVAVFLPKPIYGEAGNGMHFHHYLAKDGKPAFYKEGNYADLSDEALFFIGGLLKHGRSVLAFTSPSTNSYRRLVPGYEAPTNLFFSSGNRSAAIRIPLYADTPDTKCAEFRPGDATANPYLCLAAMLMAGLDGIKNKIDPTASGFGPFDKDMTLVSEEERAKILPVPKDLEEALVALRDDNAYLLAGGVFTEDLIDVWIRYKMDNDVRAVGRRPHPYEIAHYFDL